MKGEGLVATEQPQHQGYGVPQLPASAAEEPWDPLATGAHGASPRPCREPAPGDMGFTTPERASDPQQSRARPEGPVALPGVWRWAVLGPSSWMARARMSLPWREGVGASLQGQRCR